MKASELKDFEFVKGRDTKESIDVLKKLGFNYPLFHDENVFFKTSFLFDTHNDEHNDSTLGYFVLNLYKDNTLEVSLGGFNMVLNNVQDLRNIFLGVVKVDMLKELEIKETVLYE